MEDKKQELKDAVVSAKIKFKKNDVEAAKRLLLEDLWDTYEAMINRKWDSLSIIEQHNIGSKQIYLENTNIAIAALHMYYEGAFLCVKNNKCWSKRKLKQIKDKHQKMKPITINDI